jgi:hypothetical protein
MSRWISFILLLLTASLALAQDDAAQPTSPSLWASRNTADLATDALAVLAPDLSAALAESVGFADIVSIQSVAFSADGDAYVTVDYAVDAENKPSAGALLVLPAFAERGLASVEDVQAEGVLIAGEATGLLTPKGLHVIDELGIVLVSDTGAKRVLAWGLDDSGDVAPRFALEGGDERPIWDIWYDRGNDILYGAGVDGVAVAYDGFFALAEEALAAEEMVTLAPTRTIIPTDADGNPISVNLHGIDVDYDNNLLILSDVGDAAVNTDGQIFTIEVASLADGPTPVTARIFGEATQMGNPVDLIFDAETGGIYVAEKANDLMLFYADINGLFGDIEAAADLVLPFTKPESVEIFPPRSVLGATE